MNLLDWALIALAMVGPIAVLTAPIWVRWIRADLF